MKLFKRKKKRANEKADWEEILRLLHLCRSKGLDVRLEIDASILKLWGYKDEI